MEATATKQQESTSPARVFPRCIPQNRVINEYSPFAQHHSYLSTHELSDMLRPGYFASEHSVFLAGDTIRVTQVKLANIHDRANEVVAFAEVLVRAVSPQGLKLYVIREVDEDELGE